jgi:hypothetical protein
MLLLLPNFQRSFGLFYYPFLIGVAKVRAFMISPNLFSSILKIFVWLFFEELRFYKTGCKYKATFLFSKFYFKKVKKNC